MIAVFRGLSNSSCVMIIPGIKRILHCEQPNPDAELDQERGTKGPS
jgi:hypothetical protein